MTHDIALLNARDDVPREGSRGSRAWARFALYGIVGWAIEVVATGAWAALRDRDRAATARTYLWMHPVYGAGGLLLEQIERLTSSWPRPARAAAFLPAIYAVEAIAGGLLRRILGRCPWDYRGRGWHVAGLIRLDYAPVWWLVGYLFPSTRARVAQAAARARPAR